jgi:hypothetical protein
MEQLKNIDECCPIKVQEKESDKLGAGLWVALLRRTLSSVAE